MKIFLVGLLLIYFTSLVVSEKQIECRVIISVDTIIQKHSHVVYECERFDIPLDQPSQLVILLEDFPPDLVAKHQTELSKENWMISFPESWVTFDETISQPVMNIPQGQTVTTVQKGRQLRLRPYARRTRETEAVETNLVVLVSMPNAQPVFDTTRAYNMAFGATNSAAAQFAACSNDEFEFVPYTGRGLNGVMSLRLGGIVGAYTRSSVRLAAQQSLCQSFGYANNCNPSNELGVDHILYVVPLGINGGGNFGFLYGAVSGHYSVYGDSAGGYAPAFAVESILHELSHNFRIGHAKEDLIPSPDGDTKENPEYGDDSGMMGSSFYLWGRQNGDKRCFNGYNYWELGWMKDLRLDVNTIGTGSKINIYGISRAATAAETGNFIYARLGEFYVTYNLADGINAATKEHKNQVMIVEKVRDQQLANYYDTDFRAALDMSKTTYTSGVLVIMVCAIGDGFMTVAIGRGATCGLPLTVTQVIEPTDPPTEAPTVPPSDHPSNAPSDMPSISPTSSPAPTAFESTVAPTSDPTATPTLPGQTRAPTPAPTATFAPSRQTSAPTPVPTATPSNHTSEGDAGDIINTCFLTGYFCTNAEQCCSGRCEGKTPMLNYNLPQFKVCIG